jgi:hypothetical protein
MGRFYVGVVLPQRQGLGFAQGFLKFGGEFFDSHGNPQSYSLACGKPQVFKRARQPETAPGQTGKN